MAARLGVEQVDQCIHAIGQAWQGRAVQGRGAHGATGRVAGEELLDFALGNRLHQHDLTSAIILMTRGNPATAEKSVAFESLLDGLGQRPGGVH